MATDVLKQLDERIQASVARIQQLRKENDQLAQKLAETEKKYADAAGMVKQLNAERQQHENERNDVRTRIEKILNPFRRDRSWLKMKGVNVQIMGQSLTVASDAGDEWVKSLAETVDEKIKDIRAGSQTINSVNLAILAALNFAEELEHLRREHQELVDRIAAMNKRLSAAIDGE